ncbi:MAG: two-component system sensor histidine kinase NtrB [Rhodospirillales bacterium]
MAGWKIRIQDLVWLALFAIIAIAGPERHPQFIFALFLLAGFQVVEPKIASLTTQRGSILANLLKLAVGYLIVQDSGGITSSYYWILLIPVVSAATTLGVGGTVVFTVLACGTYLLTLLQVDWTRYTLPEDQVAELALRLMFFSVIGYLTQRLAEANREEARRAQAAAEQLAEANLNLQEAEAAVRRSERLAALGQLSAGLAHELRNPLGTMRGSAEMLIKSLPEGNEIAAELAGFISSEVDRINSLVTRFLEFARPLELKLQKAELSEVCDRAIAQLERDRGNLEVTVYKNYSPDVRPFEFDPELMERVVYNLLLNAAQATPPGGAVTIKTRLVDGMVEISVIDRGRGVDPAHIENIFNPFFTTKKDGIGLGLAIVSKIVDLHGGKITVESDPGKGSVFRVFLPLV